MNRTEQKERLIEIIRYANLEEAYDSLYALTEAEDVISDNTIEQLEEKMVWLKEMKK